MARSIKFVCTVLIAAALMAAVAPPCEAALGCGAVVNYLSPCIPYVTRNAPLGGCCNGVKRLYDAAKTTADRQSVCNCLKGLAGQYGKGANLGKAAELPGKCRVNVPYKISPSTDCKSVK